MAARTRLPPPPVTTEDKTVWNNWYIAVKDAVNNLRADLKWINLSFTGSNLSDIETKNHNDLDNIQGGSSTQRYHLTSAQQSAVASGISVTITTAKLTSGGANGSMTFTNGVLTAQTPAT